MGWKCTPQVIGLVRGEPKAGQKHRANGSSILNELGAERFSRSDTLDRTRSVRNAYSGYVLGSDCWNALEEEAAGYKARGINKNGKAYERGLRSDAVIGWAVIYNPPAEMTKDWTKEKYAKFYEDSREIMAEIKPELFSQKNVRMSAIHRDEGLPGFNGTFSEHVHDVGISRNADGHYCGNLIDAKLMTEINASYPRRMRERGWDLEDLDITDFSRMGKNADGTYKDPEYRKRRIGRKKSGKSVNEYILSKAKDADQVYTDAVNQLEEAKQLMAIAEQQAEDAAKKQQEAEQSIAVAELRARDIARQKQEAEQVIKKAKQAKQVIARAGGIEEIAKREEALQSRESSLAERERELELKAEQQNKRAKMLMATEKRLAHEKAYLNEARQSQQPNGRKRGYTDMGPHL